MADMSKFRPDLRCFGVQRNDPGWVYVIKNHDLFKIGKTTNPRKRVERDAKTWLPDMDIIGVKPFWNVTQIERSLHVGLSHYWYQGEWFRILDEHIRNLIIDGFQEFYEKDRDMNSVDFIYWMNSSGMSEFCIEQHRQKLSMPKFHKKLSQERKSS